jgi:SAM-dependent methyltransferase
MATSSRPDRIRRCKNIRDRVYPVEQRPTSIFMNEVLRLANPRATILDIGCGREGHFLHAVSGHFQAAWGIDPAIQGEQQHGNIRLIPTDAECSLPLPDASVDVIVSIDVLEHMQDPHEAIYQSVRVLKPGGHILVLVPNKWHPPLVAGRAFPHRIGKGVNRYVTGTPLEDTFRTYYRANTRCALEQIGRSLGLDVLQVCYLSDHPAYLMFSVLAYRLGVLIERCLLRREGLAWMRHLLFAHFRRPPGQVLEREGKT